MYEITNSIISLEAKCLTVINVWKVIYSGYMATALR
jgi:hypothetical protein